MRHLKQHLVSVGRLGSGNPAGSSQTPCLDIINVEKRYVPYHRISNSFQLGNDGKQFLGKANATAHWIVSDESFLVRAAEPPTRNVRATEACNFA